LGQGPAWQAGMHKRPDHSVCAGYFGRAYKYFIYSNIIYMKKN
jgi:hypothetical protein